MQDHCLDPQSCAVVNKSAKLVHKVIALSSALPKLIDAVIGGVTVLTGHSNSVKLPHDLVHIHSAKTYKGGVEAILLYVVRLLSDGSVEFKIPFNT